MEERIIVKINDGRFLVMSRDAYTYYDSNKPVVDLPVPDVPNGFYNRDELVEKLEESKIDYGGKI